MQSDNRTFDYLKRSGEWNLYIYINSNRLNYPRINTVKDRIEPRDSSFLKKRSTWSNFGRVTLFFSPSQTDVWVVGVRGAWGVSVIERGEKKNRFIVSSLTGTISSVAQVSGERVRLVISLPLGAAAVVVVRKDLVIVNVTAGQQRAPAWTTHRSGHVCVS